MSNKKPYVKEWLEDWAEYNRLPSEIKEQYKPILDKLLAALRPETPDCKMLVQIYFEWRDWGKLMSKAMGISDPKILMDDRIGVVERIAFYKRYRELCGEE